MKFDTGTRSQIIADIATSFDPTDTTIELDIDGIWYPAVWLGEPSVVKTGVKWTQTAQTTGYFAGPDATPAGAVVLGVGRHLTQTRVTDGDTVIVEDSSPIDVA